MLMNLIKSNRPPAALLSQTKFMSLLFAILPALCHAEEVGRLRDDLTALLEIDRDVVQPGEKLPLLEARYAMILSKVDRHSLGSLSNADAERFHEASQTLSFYANDPRHANQLRRAMDELQRRGINADRNRKDMLGHYFAARMVEEAIEFAANPANVDLGELPAFDRHQESGVSHRMLWQVSDDGRTISDLAFSAPGDAYVLVVGSPWCSFSRSAGEAISGDADLSRLMSDHSAWIVPQFVMPNFSDIAEWNVEHPSLRMSIVYRRSEWPEISSWATPAFHFLKDGKVLKSVTGWPDDSQLVEVEKGLKAIGLCKGKKDARCAVAHRPLSHRSSSVTRVRPPALTSAGEDEHVSTRLQP